MGAKTKRVKNRKERRTRRKRTRVPNGVVLYRGPSPVDGKPIVVIATCLVRPSLNLKTGPMIQIYILREDIDPVAASKLGEDSTVCGDCPARRVNWGWCYVILFQGPLAVWTAYHNGAYPEGTIEDLIKTRWAVRHGTYGNPASLDYKSNEWLFTLLAEAGKNWTAYEHGWRTCDQRLRRWVMASCETVEGAIEAQAKGWRPFLACLPEEEEAAKGAGLIPCPFDLHDPKSPQCYQCKLCNGNEGNSSKGIYVIAHGSAPKLNKYKQMRESLRVIQQEG